jgi:hypothetical protein
MRNGYESSRANKSSYSQNSMTKKHNPYNSSKSSVYKENRKSQRGVYS